jgi:cytochrome c oxidase subunit 2
VFGVSLDPRTDARGSAGPDLTHVGGRKGLAANAFPNDEGYLETWVTHAQALKPNSQMPDIAAFSNEELRQLTAYLRHLQ